MSVSRKCGFLAASILALILVPGSLAPQAVQEPAQAQQGIRGFAPQRVAAQRELERKLQRVPDAESAERHLRALTAAPHMAGTPGSRRVAEYIRDTLRSYGWQAELVSYRVLLPQPAQVHLELVAPQTVLLGRPEEPIELDPSSYHTDAVAAFNAYSPSGEVEAEAVYVNYGLPEDYARLRELGVSVQGRIAVARYGRSFRGVKAKVAEENGAAGLILYSDPADDGYVAGDVYPRGPFRPMSGIQRGSILYIFQYPGDPLTPGVAATDEAERIEPAAAKSLTRTPTLPVSPRDAADILSRLAGPRVPRPWQGGLPFTYHTGPGPAVVRMQLRMDYQQREIWDVIARLPGQSADEWVVAGNHHDAWVFGAVDPSSGTTVLLETARALGELARDGWKPRRTILFCFWDAEEYGLIGSVEWVEQHRAELQRKAIAYINLDSAVSGSTFGASGTPSLKELVREAAREVMDPRSGRSVYEVWRERHERGQGRRPVTSGSELPTGGDGDVPLGVLGSGSDYTPFFHHAGIASLDMGFGGEYGVYHSIYDSFQWMRLHGDPSFAYHAAMARIAGIITLRLAEADLLPFDFSAYAAEIKNYASELQTALQNAKGNLDLKEVLDAAAEWEASARRAMEALGAAASGGRSAEEINQALARVEQALLNPEGLAGRPWYKHTVFAPGTYTGYAPVLLPGVREAAERSDWATAQREARALAAALRRAAVRLEEIPRLAQAQRAEVGGGQSRR